MKGDIWYLKDQEGQIAAKFEIEDDDRCLRGTCSAAITWMPGGEPLDWEHVADVICKWDACTHWYFNGEDYDGASEKTRDSYYHLCGGYTFVGHIIHMCFVWKLAEMLISQTIPYASDEYYDHERIKQIVNIALAGYTIEKKVDA